MLLAAQAFASQRSYGMGTVKFNLDRIGKTSLTHLYQAGCAKIRLPSPQSSKRQEIVLLNSSGGMTGGDLLKWHIQLGAGAKASVTSQACEKIYRSDSQAAQLKTKLTLADQSFMFWCPQETILYDQSSFERQVTVDLQGSAVLMALEAIVFGRHSQYETMTNCRYQDKWEVSREGHLQHIEFQAFEGSFDILSQADLLGSHRAVANLLYFSTDHIDVLQGYAGLTRQIANEFPEILFGASALAGKLLMRFSAKDSYQLRQFLPVLLAHCWPDQALPQFWHF